MRLLFTILLVLLPTGVGLQGADVSDLTYTNNGAYVTITDCNASASGDLDIPAVIEQLPVRIIDNKAFLQCARLTSITIPDGVTSIGNYTFYGCRSLVSITIPQSVTSIGLTAFRDCTSLESIVIPDGVTSIRHYTFYGCTSLESITIPAGVTSIGNFAFFGCSNLESITFLGDAPTLGGDVFSGLPEGASAIIRDDAIGFGDRFGGLEVITDTTGEAHRLKFRIGLTESGQVVLSFSAAVGSMYAIESSSDMRDWERLESEIAGAGDYVLRLFPASAKKRFFRLLEKGRGE